MIQNEIVEAYNSTELFLESLEGRKYIEMYCSPLLFEWLSKQVQIISNKNNLVATILYNALPEERRELHLNSMFSIRGSKGRIYLLFSALRYFPNDANVNEVSRVFQDFLGDITLLGFKGIVPDIENQKLLIPINVEIEYSSKREFVDLVKIAVDEMFGEISMVIELPEITAARIITSTSNFVITPYSGCYNLATIKEYIQANLKY